MKLLIKAADAAFAISAAVVEWHAVAVLSGLVALVMFGRESWRAANHWVTGE